MGRNVIIFGVAAAVLFVSAGIGCSEQSQDENFSTTVDWSQLRANPAELTRLRMRGESLYREGLCVGCHGEYRKATTVSSSLPSSCPTHSDQNWYWGAELEDIFTTIKFGVRKVEPTSEILPCTGSTGAKSISPKTGTRWSVMPRFEETLSESEIRSLASAVRKMSTSQRLDRSEEILFAANCADCHGAQGNGNARRGAPRLSDGYWEIRLARDYLEEFIAYGGYILTSYDGCLKDKGHFSYFNRRHMQAYGDSSCGILLRMVRGCYVDSDIIALAVYVKSLSSQSTKETDNKSVDFTR